MQSKNTETDKMQWNSPITVHELIDGSEKHNDWFNIEQSSRFIEGTEKQIEFVTKRFHVWSAERF